MAREIHLDDGLLLRFNGRSDEFADGFEAGMLAVLMDQRLSEWSRWINSSNVEQVRALAAKQGYRVLEGEHFGAMTRITLSRGQTRPKLRVVQADCLWSGLRLR